MADDQPGADPRGPSPHAHGPAPSFEWILEGEREIVLPHLKAIAPLLQWNEEHFHVSTSQSEDPDVPALFRIELGAEPVGGVDFLPLPAKRTLMRLYLCSDLGTSCRLDDGNTIIQGFATAWLQRLQRLGFISAKVAEQQVEARSLGFRTPSNAPEPTPSSPPDPS